MALNPKQRLLAQGLARGMTQNDACKQAGFKFKSAQAAGNQVARMMKKGEFCDYLNSLQRKTESETILTVKQRKEILSQMAKGQGGDESPSDKRQAIAELNKMDGDYKPVKQEVDHDVTITLNKNW